MKKIFTLLVGLLVFFNSNAQWNLCDSSFQLYITNQTASEATVSSNQNVIGNSYSYVYFDMQFNCIGGTSISSTPENLFIFGQNSILDSTILYLGITDTLGITCYVIDTLVLNNNNWSFLNSNFSCVDSSLIDPTAACFLSYDPVCGCNGITYDNDCFAENLGGVTSWTSGPCNSNPPPNSTCEMFDNYNNGDPIAQTLSDWNTWGELMNGTTAPFADDANISTNESYSGNNSLYLFSGATQGAQDVVLPFGTTAPYELGIFEFSSMFYVNAGTGAYFNFQAENVPGTTWSLDCKMDLGTLVLENTGSSLNYLTTTYPEEIWFELKIICDLTNNIWELFLDGVSKGIFTNTVNKIASLDLYPIIGHQFYIDDVCYSYDTTQIVLDNLNLATSSIINISGLEGQLRYPSVNVINLGSTNINSFDIDFDYNGTTITENISGLNITTVGIYQVDFLNNITLLGGSNTGTATIYNINGMLVDDDLTDNIITTQITAITPAVGKLVVGEEATGTWCGWCPRGAVALNWMDKDYEGYWQGIAVHNGDPMADPDYDNGLYPFHSGSFPSGVVDRTNNIDPSEFKQDFLQRIIIEPNGIITNGAELNGNTLKVSLTVDIQNNINGNYKLACVLVEDSVYGNSTQYNQNNSYSGGSSLIDVDGTDWNTLPTSVNYTQVVYRHVGRSIAPTFAGEPLSTTSLTTGDTETICFEFTLDPSWDQSQIHIVGMFINDNNQIDNASSTDITTAVNTGYIPCAATSIGVELNGPNRVNIYPNPSSDKIYISNLKEDNISMKVYDIKGRLVIENKVSNKEYLNISKLSKGVYQIKFKGSDWNETRKLIKE